MRTPSQREALDRVLADFRADIHTTFPAKVLAYDVDAQTVDVRAALLREIPGDDPDDPWGYERIPDLYAVPIKWPRAGGFIITFPIDVGDWVKIDCAEQSTMNWRTKGDAPSHPGINDPHGLNGIVAEVGWFPDLQKATGVSTTKLVIGKPDGTAILAVAADGSVTVGSGVGAPKSIADATLVLAALAQLAAGVVSAGGTVDPSFPTMVAQIALSKAKGF